MRVRAAPPGVGQQHESEQPGYLAVIRKESTHLAGEADRFRGQFAALQVGPGRRRIALVEDQVQHVQHDRQPRDPLGLRGEREGDMARLDLLLGTADPLGDSRVRDEEGAGDLRGRKSADRAQGQRELRRRGKGRMSAEKEKRQRVVLFGGDLLGVGRRLDVFAGQLCRRPLLAAPSSLVAAQLVGQPANGDRDQPAARVLGDSLLGPLERGREQGLLYGVLSQVEVAVTANE